MRSFRTSLVLGAALAVIVAPACRKAESTSGPAPVRVNVANPTSQPVTAYEEFTGSVGALQSVDLVARAEGTLDQILFKDGSIVKKGTPLFVTQQDTYIENLKLYQAQLDYAKAEYDRQGVMIKQNATSQASLQQWASKLQEAEANTALAKIELGYTSIAAPFDGLLGEHQVDVGNVVGTNQADPTLLVTIEQIRPIYVNFSINTRDALRLRQLLRERHVADKDSVGRTPVFAGLESEEGYPHEGILDFANNSVDTSTGTVQLRAIFPNEDFTLFPGLFARVRIPLGPPTDGLVVPNAAVLSDQQGDYVFTVNADDVVERRNVTRGPVNGANVEITTGLSADDRVIVNGFGNVRIGQTVDVVPAADPSDPSDPTPQPSPTPEPTAEPSPTPAT